jgi:hypothetical protein
MIKSKAPIYLWFILTFIFAYLYSYPFDIFSRIDSVYAATDLVGGIWAFDWKLVNLAHGNFGQLFAGNIFYPLQNASLLNENPLSQALLSIPIYWLTGDSYYCYQWSIYMSYWLSSLGMFLLARNLGLNAWGALGASLIFAFNGYRYGISPYAHQSTMQWMPFTLIFINKYFENNIRSNLYWAAVFYCLQITASAVYFILFSNFLFFFVFIKLYINKFGQWKLLIKDSVVPCFLTLIVILTNYLPYWDMSREHQLARSIGVQVYYGASLLSFLHHSHSYFLKDLLGLWRPSEGIVAPGIIATLLTFAVVWRIKLKGEHLAVIKKFDLFLLFLVVITGLIWQYKPSFEQTILGRFTLFADNKGLVDTILLTPLLLTITVRLFLTRFMRGLLAGLKANENFFLYFILASVAFWISLGPIVKTYPDKYLMLNPLGISLYYLFPGLDAIRAISRMAGLIPLAMGITAGFGIMIFQNYFTTTLKRAIFTVAIFCLILLELYPAKGANFPYVGKSSQHEPEYIWLKDNVSNGAIYEWPADCIYCNAKYMERSIYHGKLLVNGYASWEWDGIKKLKRENDFSDLNALQSLYAFGVKYFVVHKQGNSFPEWAKVKVGYFNLEKRFDSTLIYKNGSAKTKYLPENYVESLVFSKQDVGRDFHELCFVFRSPKQFYVNKVKRNINIKLIGSDKETKDTYEIPVLPTLWKNGERFCSTRKKSLAKVESVLVRDREMDTVKEFIF